ncbi:RNA polymerase sigma factor [Dyadobacter chenhuakuii]|uniref:Sigma-70 family RNA polymerase sigma factor n=1 Tax=Dyadobacter chenhuakuii TaxID=2909339 RepID=A0ABY4XNB2_9BACT|nr:sigma-70 family RNA polymerase sigma factor [Dyadobacter chenhuakuii]MCF2495067.1 sigma-70 family RNA polymerase sigma factor [Dyadobacter chenhuakuii]USJ31620.1 sigma-70 family RNA polymerase sigma factor [Dyadobacter chenhuakuii]
MDKTQVLAAGVNHMESDQNLQNPPYEHNAGSDENAALTQWALLQKQDATAFECIYKTYARLLHNYGYRLVADKELVKDTVQDLFVQLWNNAPTLPAVASVKAYLIVALRRELLRRITRQRKFVNQEAELAEASAEDQLIEAQAGEMISDGLSKFIEKLPTRQREIIFLKYYSGLSTEEIAAAMDLTSGSVYKLVYKALDSLKALTSDWKTLWIFLLIALQFLLLESDIGQF